MFEWVVGGLRDQLRLSDEIKRVSANADKLMTDVFDDEKRLIKVETIIDLARGGFVQRSLPSE